MLALPLLFASCKPKATATKKMDAGAQQITEGVRGISKTVEAEAQHAKDTAPEKVMETAADAVKEMETIKHETAIAVEEVVDTANEEIEETKPEE